MTPPIELRTRSPLGVSYRSPLGVLGRRTFAEYLFFATEQTIVNPTRGYDGCVLGSGAPDLQLTTMKHRPDLGGDEWAWANVNQIVDCVGETSGFTFTWRGDLATCDEITSIWYPLIGEPGSVGQWAQAGRGGDPPYIVDQLRIWTDNGLGYLMPNGEQIKGSEQEPEP